MRSKWLGLAALTALAACGAEREQDGATTDTATAVADAAAVDMATNAPVVRHLAYDFRYGFRVAGDRLDDAQRAHIARCDALGPDRCVVLTATLDGQGGRFGRGTLEMKVATSLARALGDGLRADIDGEKGELLSASIEGQDLDAAVGEADAAAATGADARDRVGRAAAAEGRVLDRVAAQNAATAARAGADAARLARAALARRLAASKVTVAYESALPVSTRPDRPVAAALAGALPLFSEVFAFLLTLVAGALPFGLAGGLGWLAYRAVDRRHAPARAL